MNIPDHSSGWQDFSRTIHSKYLVVDGRWSWVGTSNWSKDYFYGSRNVGLIVESPEFAARLDKLHGDIWNGEYAEVVDPKQTYTAPYQDHKAQVEAAQKAQ